MNEELNSYVATLIDETQMVMDEFQTPVMAFTSTVLEKIEDLLDCKDITVEHCKIMDKAGKASIIRQLEVIILIWILLLQNIEHANIYMKMSNSSNL